MNSKLLVNSEIRSDIPEVDEYISLLESIVTAYTADNATRMVAEANRVIGILADDLSLIAEDGSIKGTKLIKEEKNNMAMDRIVKLMQQASVIANISMKSVAIGKQIAYDISRDSAQQIKEDDQELVDNPTILSESLVSSEQDEDMVNSSIPLIEQLSMSTQRKSKK